MQALGSAGQLVQGREQVAAAVELAGRGQRQGAVVFGSGEQARLLELVGELHGLGLGQLLLGRAAGNSNDREHWRGWWRVPHFLGRGSMGLHRIGVERLL